MAGRLAVLGSCHMFSDQYLDKEENSKIMVSVQFAVPLHDILQNGSTGCSICLPSSFLMSVLQDVVFQWLMTDSIHLNQIDAEDPEVNGT